MTDTNRGNLLPVVRKRPRWQRSLKITAAAIFVVGLISCCTVDRLITAAILHPLRRGTGAAVPEGMTEQSYPVADNVKIHAWVARPEGQPAAIVFVLHGIADSKASQEGPLRFLVARGIVGIAPDLRAHGQSGGDNATYGFLEKKDLSRLREAAAKEFPGVPVGIWGTSYGGAVALQALGIDPRFDFAIVESTFADLRDMARQQVVNHTPLPVSRIGPHYMNRAGQAAGFDPGAVSPEISMESIKVPLLHLHGENDEVIPIAQGRRIASHAKSKNYRFVPIKNGTHYHLRDGDPQTYEREVKGFLDRMSGGK